MWGNIKQLLLKLDSLSHRCTRNITLFFNFCSTCIVWNVRGKRPFLSYITCFMYLYCYINTENFVKLRVKNKERVAWFSIFFFIILFVQRRIIQKEKKMKEKRLRNMAAFSFIITYICSMLQCDKLSLFCFFLYDFLISR